MVAPWRDRGDDGIVLPPIVPRPARVSSIVMVECVRSYPRPEHSTPRIPCRDSTPTDSASLARTARDYSLPATDLERWQQTANLNADVACPAASAKECVHARTCRSLFLTGPAVIYDAWIDGSLLLFIHSFSSGDAKFLIMNFAF